MNGTVVVRSLLPPWIYAMQTNVSVHADELGSTAISLEKKWCPKCAAFQLAINPTCEKCGAPMSYLKAAAAAPLSPAVKCVAWIVALILALILIAAFHVAGTVIVGIFALLFAIGARAQERTGRDSRLMSPEER